MKIIKILNSRLFFAIQKKTYLMPCLFICFPYSDHNISPTKMSSKPTNVDSDDKQLTYYGNPSGREILTKRLEELIENYNQEAQRESELLERTKKEVHELTAAIIKVTEANHQKRQEERHTKMSEAINRIQEVLTKLDEEEKELCKFASCLSQLQANVKSP